ncbi:MAG TPA: phosphodiester glycosidase family protein [Candidatus Nanopelagicales bacterium]|nr:phosphodiester glycosidase family protein [Candidatus Nanopelagicales bacterium]
MPDPTTTTYLSRSAPRHRPSTRRTRRARRLRRTVLVAVLALLLVSAWSLADALRQPGDDIPTKTAEWARDHGLGALVTLAEDIQYRLSPPRTGGAPDSSVLAAGAREAPIPRQQQGGDHVPLQPRIVGPVAPQLAGEGVYVPVERTTAGPLVQVTYVRPDAVHTSYLAGVAWMSRRLRFVLHPGFQDPGTTGMSQPATIPSSAYRGLAVSFNGGFKLKDAAGGYYDHGTTASPLVAGAASFVVYKDGRATVGVWGSDVRMGPSVAYVRQNLKPLVVGGAVVANLDSNVQSSWGATVGGSFAVWRSGIGVTAAGDLVYVSGDALSVAALADLLHRAGAVTAMQLDINKAWVSFMWYSHGSAGLTPHKLGDFQRPADRYLGPVSRDFVTAYLP